MHYPTYSFSEIAAQADTLARPLLECAECRPHNFAPHDQVVVIAQPAGKPSLYHAHHFLPFEQALDAYHLPAGRGLVDAICSPFWPNMWALDGSAYHFLRIRRQSGQYILTMCAGGMTQYIANTLDDVLLTLRQWNPTYTHDSPIWLAKNALLACHQPWVYRWGGGKGEENIQHLRENFCLHPLTPFFQNWFMVTDPWGNTPHSVWDQFRAETSHYPVRKVIGYISNPDIPPEYQHLYGPVDLLECGHWIYTRKNMIGERNMKERHCPKCHEGKPQEVDPSGYR